MIKKIGWWVFMIAIVAIMMAVGVVKIYENFQIYKWKNSFKKEDFLVTSVETLRETTKSERSGYNYIIYGHVISNDIKISTTYKRIKTFMKSFPVTQTGETIKIWFSEKFPDKLIPRDNEEIFPVSVILNKLQIGAYIFLISLIVFGFLIHKRKMIWEKI